MRVGNIEISPLRDGWFFPPEGYLGETAHPERHEGLRDEFEASPEGSAEQLGRAQRRCAGVDLESGAARFPIGCFLLRTPNESVLIDTGVGQLPTAMVRELAREGYRFAGGDLPRALQEARSTPEEIDAILCTHLHLDHCGGLLAADGGAAFEDALLWIGRADWQRFVVGREGSMTHGVRAVLEDCFRRGQVQLLEGDRAIASGVTALATPGHTPGHYSVVVSDGNEQAFILGDAVTCPAQLAETKWHALSDVDPGLAARTRERLFQALERGGAAATGCHFPGLEFGQVIKGAAGRTWSRLPRSQG